MTVKLWISSTVRRNSDADELLREFAEKKGITGRDFNHLCLLTEETLGMAGTSTTASSGWKRPRPDMRSSWKRTCAGMTANELSRQPRRKASWPRSLK